MSHQVEQAATELQTFSQLKKQEDIAIPRRQEVSLMVLFSLALIYYLKSSIFFWGGVNVGLHLFVFIHSH